MAARRQQWERWAAVEGIADAASLNEAYQAIFGFPKEPLTEELVTEVLLEKPVFVARIVASTFDIFGTNLELCKKVALELLPRLLQSAGGDGSQAPEHERLAEVYAREAAGLFAWLGR